MEGTKTRPEAPLSGLRRVITCLRLFPKNHDFFGYFKKSGETVVKGTNLLCEMIENREKRPEFVRRFKDIEHEGDKITHDVIDLLHCTFLTPFDRSDMHTLIVNLDDILDIAYFVGNRLTRYGVNEMPEEMIQMARIVHRASQEVALAVCDLENLKNSKTILKRCIEVNRLENEADEKINVALENLFKNNWEPIQVIKLKELLENLEAAADKCEDVANIIESIVLKNA